MLEIRGIWLCHMSRWVRYVLRPRVRAETSGSETVPHIGPYMLPQARSDWLNLRFQDFKSVPSYNSALHRIVFLLRMCGQKVTNAEIIYKTLSTFHPTNM